MKANACQPAGYDTDLSDAEWELLRPLLYPADAKRQRAPDSARACLDAIRYVLKTGCQWSLLPRELVPKSTVHDALSSWTEQGLWPRINEALRTRTRLLLKKRHAQRRCAQAACAHRNQRFAARRCGHPASVQDRDGAKLLLCMFCHSLLSLLMIFADGGCAGKLEAFVHGMGRLFGHGASFGLGIVKKLEDQKGFIVLPRRWVIERSFGWLVKQRCRTRDHEKTRATTKPLLSRLHRHHDPVPHRFTAVQPFAG